MPPTDTQIGPGRAEASAVPPRTREQQFTLPDSPNLFASLLDGIREWRCGSRAAHSEYYRGEAVLPVTEMQPWYRDFTTQVKSLFEKPTEPIGIFNRAQDKKRALCALAAAVIGAGAAWALALWVLGGPPRIVLGVIAGLIVGEILAVVLFRKQEYPPDIWQEYQ